MRLGGAGEVECPSVEHSLEEGIAEYGDEADPPSGREPGQSQESLRIAPDAWGRSEGRGQAARRAGTTLCQNTTELPSRRENGGGASRQRKSDRLANREEVRIASLNVNGFGSLARDHPNNKWGTMYRMMKEQRLGILLLQETHLTPERRKDLHRMFANRIKILHSDHPDAPTSKEGVAVVLNKRIMETKGVEMSVLVKGRAVQVSIPWRGGETRRILCVYAPTSEGPNERRRFFKELAACYEKDDAPPKPHLMAGDFNVTEDALDRFPAKQQPPDASKDALDELKRTLGLMMVDGWRETHPSAKAYTFQRGTGDGLTMARLDRIYIRPEMVPWMRDWRITPAGVKTDHNLVSAVMTTPTAPAVGKGRPVFPLHLLGNGRLAADMKTRGMQAMAEILDLRANGRTESRNPQLTLMALKRDWLEMARKQERATVPKLLREIEALEKEIVETQRAESEMNPEAARHVSMLTDQLRNAKHNRLKQQQSKARGKHRIDGEAPTKYWTALCKEQKPRELIPALEKPGVLSRAGEPTYESDAAKMAELAKKHYDSVQLDGPEITPQEVRAADMEEVLRELKTPLTGEQALLLDGMLERDECGAVLKNAKNGTAPGLDGIQYEVWKAMEGRCAEDMRTRTKRVFDPLEVLTEAFNDVQAHGVCEEAGFTDGWMAPIYKEKGERTKIANYRPITLLNTDYKIMSKVMAVRLAMVAPSIIHPAQAGFVPGRKLRDHTQLARTMIDWAEAKEVNGAIVALDQEKAYDRIAHDYLWKVMQKLGMPAMFVRTVQHLYAKARTSVVINGVTSEPFMIYRGVRQGDPLSCLLFDVAIEPLSIMIRSSGIRGLDVPGLTEAIKATLFADDTTVYLSECDKFQNVQNTLDRWCSASKAKFNIAKTEVIPIGSEHFRRKSTEVYRSTGSWPTFPMGAKIASDGEPVRILGAFLGNKVDQAGVWTPKLEKVRETLSRWNKHHISIPGKRLAVQMIAGGMTQFLTEVQSMPKDVTKRLTKIIRDFMWDGRGAPPISDEQLQMRWGKGGVDLLDIEARNEAIQVGWLRSYLRLGGERPPWAAVVDDHMATMVPKSVSVKDRDLRTSPFMQQWNPKYAAMPIALREMLAVAKKYGVRQEGRAFERAILRRMPIWDHAHADAKSMKRLSIDSTVTRCLRRKHKIRTVEEAEILAAQAQIHGQMKGLKCACTHCEREITETRCAHPERCYIRAQELMDTLPGKWDPRRPQPEDWEEADHQSFEPEDGAVAFDRRITTRGCLADTFRIFTSSRPLCNELPTASAAEQGPRKNVATDGSCKNNGQTTASAGLGVYIEEGCENNMALRLPRETPQTNKAAEIAAVIVAADKVGRAWQMQIDSDSKTTLAALTHTRGKNEDEGYIGKANSALLQMAVEALLRRRTHTSVKWVKGHAGHKGNEEADALADKGAEGVQEAQLRVDETSGLHLSGAKLQATTQRLAYRAIRSAKEQKANVRPSTAENLDLIRKDLQRECAVSPTNDTLWAAVKKNTATREGRQFIWRAIHDSFMIGRHWLRATMPPPLRNRAECHVCGCLETMNHILFDCSATGRQLSWTLLTSLWSRTGDKEITPTWGTVMGAQSVVIKDEHGTRQPTKEARWAVLATETAFLVWKMRCERVIQREGEQFTAQEATNRWWSTIRDRQKLDMSAANGYLGKRALCRQEMMKLWEPLLVNGKIREVDDGVLVGIS
ncbi:hypothetical protein ACG7TL_006609 [Trametes sanguinea]